MNYYEIGQRIRKYRKAYGLSQEQLSDMVGISATHMSHIETGNTKLSLAVLVKIADVLSVQTDALLFDAPQVNRTAMTDEISNILSSCKPQELKVITDVIKSLKISLDKNND
ncbi:helix-turn-helix domain-containing protein [Clostridioides sp. ZZV14-6150]|uniref:helix-turn-helix domain-containing protein n=1 Tax=unclassified Clostridioides TaxID=2635829 RepID=UPI001D127AC0|nr:helix-turn-helix transcriptional regulator [Clostridioides sp. ZZV14-6150]MCC0721650.1 helix-turn-helix transcriptional regulator [Clostridioides sp. ZZV14-6104]MCC0733520.1 helix-turn-helix transcriptional regulator [Clostridioides sp. ZZV14-6009]MCC0750173.1 helix-turn-helix transcriptional regulator [Clostridioides sp. ZZV13-5731]